MKWLHREHIDKNFWKGIAIILAMSLLVMAISEIIQRIHPLKLDHSKWRQRVNPDYVEEPIWGKGENQDDILGWHLIQNKKLKHYWFVTLGKELPPNNVWVAAQGYLILSQPVDTKGMSSKEKQANRYKNKIFFKFVDCLSGGSTIVSSDECVFEGVISVPVSVANNDLFQ